MTADYEEVEYICEECGRRFKIVKLVGVDVDEPLCNRCSGEILGVGDFGEEF